MLRSHDRGAEHLFPCGFGDGQLLFGRNVKLGLRWPKFGLLGWASCKELCKVEDLARFKVREELAHFLHVDVRSGRWCTRHEGLLLRWWSLGRVLARVLGGRKHERCRACRSGGC